MQAFCFSIKRLLLVFVDVLHIEAQCHEVGPSNSPLDVKIRRPSANAGVAGVREDRMGRDSGDNQTDIATPDRAIFWFLQIRSHYLQIVLHAFGYPDATSLPPASDRFISGSNGVVEGHGQAE